jgi:hypothetical protein
MLSTSHPARDGQRISNSRVRAAAPFKVKTTLCLPAGQPPSGAK